MVILEKFELAQDVSAEWSGRWEGGCLERFYVLMGISVNDHIHLGVFAVFELDVLCRLEFASWEANVKGDIVGPFVQREARLDLWS